MSRFVFDIETDGLLDELTRVWIIVAHDLDTSKKQVWLEGDLGWVDVFQNADLLIGHNVIDFDFPALKKVYGFELNDQEKVHDTMIMSQVLDYKRFGNKGHSMEVWGEHFGQPKQAHEDWTQYSPEMYTRCVSDVDLNIRIYDTVLDEFFYILERNQSIKTYLQAEHSVSWWCAECREKGWPFKTNDAKALLSTLEAEMNKAHEILSAKLGIKCVAVDKCKGEVPWKEPKWTKQGFYHKSTADWFGVHPCSGFEGEERLIRGPYSRVKFVPLSLTSTDDVKLFLFRNGWKPTQWNYKHDPETGERYKTSPKITEDSLEFLGGDGKLYTDFLTVRSRYGVVKTWVENVDENDNLHGECFTIGTPSMRMRHQIIVNVPSGDSAWGPEMRRLFSCPPGWSLVGCDSKGNQVRGLAHFIADERFIDVILNGDIHQFNADRLTEVLKSMGIDHTVIRPRAKRILYAFLFGAAGGKLWSYIFDTVDDKKGAKLKNGFQKSVPGFKELLDKLKAIFSKTKQSGEGYIPSLAGTRIYVDSYHKLLVYLLQSTEKITCAAACLLLRRYLKEENIPYLPCIFMHDELDFAVPEEHKQRAMELGIKAFKEGPKLFGVDIMDGDGKVGKDWLEIH
jgi:hypothetical protein